MIMVVIVASVAKVRCPAPCVRETFPTGHTIPLKIIVQAERSSIALRKCWRIQALKAPPEHVRTGLGMAVRRAVELFQKQASAEDYDSWDMVEY